jgi:hypothetical protein
MTVLLPDQLDDFVNLTLENFKRKKWVDISLDLQNYEFASRFFSSKKDPEKGGSQLNWKVQVTNTGTARHSELYDTDQTGVVDLTKEAKIPWSKQTVNFSYDVDEDAMQTDRETIINEIKVRDHSMYNDYFELMEEALWSMPSGPDASPRPPSGIPYWIVKSATTGFNGGNPSNFTSGAGGLSSTTYPNWSNYTFAATDVSRDDFIEKALKACEFTKFLAPKKFPELGGAGDKNDYAFYTTYRVLQQLEKYLQSSNDNLGVDIAKYSGAVTLKGNPVNWVPYLEANDTEDPFYGINWKVFRYFFKKGRHMLRQPPRQRDGQHTVRVVHMDNWGNFQCENRRRTFVGYFANGVS